MRDVKPPTSFSENNDDPTDEEEEFTETEQVYTDESDYPTYAPAELPIDSGRPL